MKKTEGRGTNEISKTDVEESRRKFLKQAGKLAVYTPPAMVLLMKPSAAATLLSGLNGIPNPCGENGEFNSGSICPD